MLYRFAHCTLDTQLHTLCRAGQSAVLSPKVFEVLCYLIGHREQVVSKQELCDNVWQGLAISDATLESCIRTVRVSVGDSGQAQRIIQTQRGYGYLFIATVEMLAETPRDDVAATATPPALQPGRSAQEQPPTAPASPPSLLPGMRPCGVCTRVNPEDATFCAACGTRLRQRCSYCGQDVALPAVFCVACGQPLVPLPPPALTTVSTVPPWLPTANSTPPGQGGFSAERKLVTVLCCTVAPMATHDARVDLDTLHSLMQALHDLARDVVQQYGGWIHSVVGDRLLIIFGVPVVQEDHARRAVRVALALRQHIHELRQGLGEAPGVSLALRVGLHTGLVVESRWDDTASAVAVVGDVVSLAVALQTQAEPGQILCSDATAHLVRETARLDAVGLVQVAEQVSPIATYAVLGSSMRRTPGGQHREQGLSPFVGREREMATLHALLTQIEAGRGQVVGVVGEAGIGKSRLVAEFCHSLRGRPLTYLTGRCLSYGSATPYLPLLDLLRHNCGITEADSPEDITAKIRRSLQEVDMSPETWAPAFLSLLGVQEGLHQLAALSPEARKAHILTACTQLCLNGSRQRPLVLEIEDLHWIDASSEACLAAIVERIAGMPLLLLVTARPGYRPPWIDKSYTTQLALTPLDPQGSRRVVQAIVGTLSLPEPTLEAILARADGNPLFLEELTHTVIEGANASQKSLIPATLQAVLTARIDRLMPDAKRLLQVAAVIGKHVPLPVLQAVVAIPAELLQRHLGHLQTAELLYETTWAATPTVTFKHVLIQEAAYQSLLEGTRQQVHRQIAQILATQCPQVEDTQPEWLAHHYTEAGLREQALVYWQRAGQYALDRSAYTEAVAHLTRGLQILRMLPNTTEYLQRELDLLALLGPALMATKGYAAPEVEETYARARALCEQMGETPYLFPVLRGLWGFYFVRAELQTAQALGKQLLCLAHALQDPSHLIVASYAVGATLFHRGAFLEARVHLERGNHLYAADTRRLDNTVSIDHGLTCLLGTSWVLHILGYPDQALQKSRTALQLVQEMGHPFGSAVALSWAARLHQFRREPHAVHELAEALIALSTEQGFALWLGLGREQLAWTLIVQGQQEEGMAVLRETLVANRATGRRLTHTYQSGLLAEAYGNMGQAAEGLRTVAETFACMEQTGERFGEAELHRIKGELLLQRDRGKNTVAAEGSFHRALELARGQQARWWELRAAMSLSRLWQRQGKRQAACQLLTDVYGWFAEGLDTTDLQEAKALVAELS